MGASSECQSGENGCCVEIACVPDRGWVVVQTEWTGEWPNPVFELSVLSEDGQALASTIVMDAPPVFRITLHPRVVESGMPLLLRVKLLRAEDPAVTIVGEYPFVFESSE
jgi:hypothetical protein